ncbi:MAG: M67 family metallopeptidase [Chloroflexi bacterium]|nr:M67 family metallopeptidase [Chloroflexota bacterium]MCC6891216.1 M67 family metallopeptidase [Anaerolineae bacterium]
MQLWLRPVLARTIIDHAQRNLPNECCGVIIGVGIEAHEVVPVPNIATEPELHYRMDDRVLTELFFRTQRDNKAIIGFYHSHPTSEPVPSRTDVALASYPDMAYVIASLRGEEARLAAWSIKPGQVKAIELSISESKPTPEEAPLSLVQKRAIIASVIIAFLFMLVLSLSLLPPAPVIPVP